MAMAYKLMQEGEFMKANGSRINAMVKVLKFIKTKGNTLEVL